MRARPEGGGEAPAWRPVLELADRPGEAVAPLDRLRHLRRMGAALRERLLDEPVLPWVASAALARVPYPAWYAFTGVRAQRLLSGGMVHLMARIMMLRFIDYAGVSRLLLFNPHDIERGAQTPFFRRMADRLPDAVARCIAPFHRTVPEALREAGIAPEAVDYVCYDHLHTQDLRRWLGQGDDPGCFPNARLLVHRAEWRSVQGLLPHQADWYCPQGVAGIDARRVCCFDDSVQLGPGVALVHTPGHTMGNCSLVFRGPAGVHASSENGVSSDSWAPAQSRVNAIRRYARDTGAEVVLNGNTQEGSVEQYLSMVLEKAIAGPGLGHPFTNVIPSSECTPHWLFPGAPRSHLWGDLGFGARPVG